LAFIGSFVLWGAHDDSQSDSEGEARLAQTFDVRMEDIRYAPATLTVQVGDTVRWTNRDVVPHTVTPTDKAAWGSPGSGDASATWLAQGETWSFTFTEPGTYRYFCIPHASKQANGEYAGMVGTVVVSESSVAGPKEGEPAESRPDGMKAVDVNEIGARADDVPPPAATDHAYFEITSREVIAEMADGTTFPYWTFDGQVPGPMLRVRQGALVTVNLTNAASSTMGHNIDFHAATGPGGGASALNALPGETNTLTFRAMHPGLFVYHCAYQDPPLHVAHGMYGLILVEPAEGLPPVDHEFYVVQGDFYSPFAASAKGHHEHSEAKANAEEPTFVVFNGRMGSLADADRQLQAKVNETVRIYFGVGGPNLVSSFHVIGEVFDRVYTQGDLATPPQRSLQTTLVPAGGAAVVDFRLEVPGDYLLVDHSLYRVHKGGAGILHVTGPAAPDIFQP